MPGSTARAKISKGIRGATAPVSERQQLALLMQMTSDDNQGPGPGQAATSGDAAAHGVGGGSGTATGPGPTVAATSPAANPSPSRSKARNERGETPLHLAAIKGDLSQVRRLLEAGSDPNVADFAGWTPLHEASNHGWLRVAGALLRAGAHVNVKGWDDDTPLHDAAVNGHFKLVRLLMRHGADPHLRNVRGKTPLDVARQDVVFLMTDTNPFSSDSDSDLLRSDEDDAEGADRSDRATDGSTTSVSRGAARALVLPRTPPTRRNSTASGAASARGAPAEMRRAPPQNKAVEKPASPRVTLRLHHLKTRDDRKAANKPTERESLSNNRSQLSGNMEGKGSGEDVYEFKSSKEATPVRGASASPEPSSKMNESTNPSDNKERDSKPDAAGEPPHAGGKRNATEMVDGDEGDEETRRKKRKETENPSKENTRNSTPSRSANGRNGSANSDKSKPAPGKISSNLAGKPNSNQDKNPELKSGTSSGSNSPKPTTSGSAVSSSGSKSVEGDSEDTLGGKGGSEAIGPKVPPLKIVIPQQSAALEPEPGTRVGKNGNSRHHQALPYVVASSNSNDSVPEKEGGGSGSASPTDSLDKKDSTLTEDQRSALNHQRVLRSSNRSGNGGANPSGSRSSSPTAGSVGGEDTSPQQSRQQSPAPVENAASSVPETTSAPSPGKSSTTSIAPANVVVDEKPGQTEASTLPPQSTPTPATQTSSMELHPRKRKLKPHREQPPAPAPSTGNSESTEPPYTSTEVHPHEQPITNCYQLFLNIRKQIERRRKNLFPVQPKPPQGFKDYLMNRCTYVLTSNASTRIAAPNSPPASLIGGLRDLFVDQEKERQKLKMQHIIEKEKLVLSVEQEILRVHGRAARALANQALPFSACSILKDEEVYNVITPEQEEKDRNARSRYNGRLFLSWLQDVDDKWEKIKESMLLRHHNEAESLHAVQRMDWDWKMKEVGPCEDCPPVPMVHVSDDFDLLPA